MFNFDKLLEILDSYGVQLLGESIEPIVQAAIDCGKAGTDGDFTVEGFTARILSAINEAL